jgi:chemotaxis protein methyltransferase CheR
MIPGDSSKIVNNTFQLGDLEYIRLSSYIMSQFGIKLPPNKKTLLQCRLQKRLKALNLDSFREYVDYVFSSQGIHEEVSNMIDAVSTNKTDFFREPIHFDFLYQQGISEYMELTGKNKLNIWSAGCSSGEEPFTLAMVMKEFSVNHPAFDFSILATDISESVLQHAEVGIYHEDKTRLIPYDYKKKYLLKGKSDYKNKVRIIPELRMKIDFRKYNLLNTDYSSLGKFDIIFCRNVMIYFEREVQYRLLKQFCKVLNTGGYLFLGHSESITGYSLPLQHLRPTIFSKIKKG